MPVAADWALMLPHDRPIACDARRGGERSHVHCEMPALHPFGCIRPMLRNVHGGRGRSGQWFFWPVG